MADSETGPPTRPGPHLVAYPVACYDSPLTAKLSLV
jgi:hypothetical protein